MFLHQQITVFAHRIKEARLKKGLKQIQVTERTGINNKAISNYENAISTPDYNTLKTLCDLYEVSTDWVLGNVNNPVGELTEEEKVLARATVELDSDTFLNGSILFKGRELTEEEKKKLQEMARLFLS